MFCACIRVCAAKSADAITASRRMYREANELIRVIIGASRCIACRLIARLLWRVFQVSGNGEERGRLAGGNGAINAQVHCAFRVRKYLPGLAGNEAPLISKIQNLRPCQKIKEPLPLLRSRPPN